MALGAATLGAGARWGSGRGGTGLRAGAGAPRAACARALALPNATANSSPNRNSKASGAVPRPCAGSACRDRARTGRRSRSPPGLRGRRAPGLLTALDPPGRQWPLSTGSCSGAAWGRPEPAEPRRQGEAGSRVLPAAQGRLKPVRDGARQAVDTRHRSALSGRGSAFGAAGRAVRSQASRPRLRKRRFGLTRSAILGDDPSCSDWIGPLGL